MTTSFLVHLLSDLNTLLTKVSFKLTDFKCHFLRITDWSLWDLIKAVYIVGMIKAVCTNISLSNTLACIASVSVGVGSKESQKILFFGLSLLPNPTETLVTQASNITDKSKVLLGKSKGKICI